MFARHLLSAALNAALVLAAIMQATHAAFDLTEESYYPPIIGKASSWFHLQYLQLNKHFVSSSVLHACECQITRVNENTKYKLAQGRAYGSEDWGAVAPALPSQHHRMILDVRLELTLKSGVGYNLVCKGAVVDELNMGCVLMHLIPEGLITPAHLWRSSSSCTEGLWGF